MSEIKIFNEWDISGVEIKDLGLQQYLKLTPHISCHTHGRHEHKRFHKSQVNIVERFINRLLSPGASRKKNGGRQTGTISGKKAKTINLIKNVFKIINLKTHQNPVQILMNAVVNSAPREETTRISYGGINYQQSVDVAPQRRVDLSLKFLVEACWRKSFNTISTIEEIIANELILAANNDSKSSAVKRKEEKERIAASAR
ncbi:MAG TPA: 30S ribosomal protein S7 [Candidatus Deferrimicrobium sp.]|nr:30S ribosomal protein S7 [Candidatus Deferrimicrobium sp.]